MLLYSILFPIISVIAIIFFLVRYLTERQSLTTTILWTILWLFVILFSVFPEASGRFASLFGVTRGLDFIIIVGFAVLLYVIFRLYSRLDKLQDEVNVIVKEIALSNEMAIDDEEE